MYVCINFLCTVIGLDKVCRSYLQLLGFAPRDGGSKYLYDGDYTVKSLTVSL